MKQEKMQKDDPRTSAKELARVEVIEVIHTISSSTNPIGYG
jgi:hypothetical protein